MGGFGCSMRELGKICATVAYGCGSSAMVLAMHYSQLACLVRHGLESRFFNRFARDLATGQHLLASMTSEVGTSGDTRSSICAIEPLDGKRFRLDKEATTGSYCEHADAIVVTCRRSAEAPASDQVLVLAQKADYQLSVTSTWDTLGMRGTCSPGFSLRSNCSLEQILPGSFAESSAVSMVPYSHILWSSLWYGIVAAAVARAGTFVRAQARKRPGVVSPVAVRFSALSADLQDMRHNWESVADDFDRLEQSTTGREALMSIGWALKLNNLKMSASNSAPRLVHQALQILGVPGYKNDSQFSVGRHYRDVLSAALMISNDRIAENNASMLLVFKDEGFLTHGSMRAVQ
jgi:acyl-CoA dehydrogenase